MSTGKTKKRKVTTQQVARWIGREKRRKQRLADLQRNHKKNCAVFNSLPCSCR